MPAQANQPLPDGYILMNYRIATRIWAGKYSRSLLRTIDWCLELDHLKRPQSVFALQQVLLGKQEPAAHESQTPWARLGAFARRLLPRAPFG